MNLNNLISSFREAQKIFEEVKNYIQTPRNSDDVSLKTNTSYNGIIISLYGTLEKFVDDIGNNYLDIVFNCKTINHDVVESIKKSLLKRYRINLGDFLSNPNRHTDVDNSPEYLCKTLSSYLRALIKNDFRSFGKKLFLIHGANMRSEILFDFFKELGIDDLPVRICEKRTFRNFVINELGIENQVISQIQTQKNSDIYFHLNRLVEERNLIAHSGKSENKISINDIVSKIIPFLLIFCETLFKCIGETLISSFDVEYNHVFVDHSIKHLYDNCILCHESDSHNIMVNNYFVVSDGAQLSITKIISIELDNCSIKSTGLKNAIFGFKVDEYIRKNSQLISYL